MFDKLKQLLNSKKELPWFKYYGKMPKRLKYFEGSLYEYMENTAIEYPNNCALEFFNKKMTYKRLLEEIDELALSLSNDGIKENDIVTICMANSPEAVVAFYAINKIGAISNIIHPLSSENEIKDFIQNTNSQIVFASDILYDSILSYLPIFHGFGLCVAIHTPLTYGMRCVLDPKIDVKKINSILKKKKINFLPVIPALLNVMVKDKTLSKNAFSNLRYIVSGGDFLNIELKERAEKFVKNHGSSAKIIVGYGLTEAMAAVCASIEPNYKKKSVGVPLPDNRYKIVKVDTHIPCEPNEVGEICLTGPSLMSRYFKNDEETFKALQVHDDGLLWLHTGDLGYYGNDDVLYFETRKKRVIISNGFNIYPSYIEEVLNKHPYVETSIVVGQKDKDKAQVAKAVIVLKDEIEDSEKTKNEIKLYLKQSISKYAVPKIYEFTKELPKTKVGKVDFKALEK